MENILQSIVKIIIIGSLCTNRNVDGNPQFLPPPLPYFQNEGFFLPGFVPPYHEPIPVFYKEENPPPPISFQNVNSFTPPRLFHQNENYYPPQFTKPNVRYSVPLYEPAPPQVHDMVQKNIYKPPQFNYNQVPMKTPQKKPGFYSTNIVVKDEPQTPFYRDENKNYQEDDYDNYSDEVSPSKEPCLPNYPYQYFEPHKKNAMGSKLPLCNSHLQPNSEIYQLKMPITLLPSRFPPRVEQLIERIQTYFSTYTQQVTPKPENASSIATPVQPLMEVTNTTQTPVATTIVSEVTDQKKKNVTTEIEELTLEEHNMELPELTTVKPPSKPQVTIVVEVESTNEEGKLQKSQPPVEIPSIQAESITSNESVPHLKSETSQMVDSTAETPCCQEGNEKMSQNQISNELTPPETVIHPEKVMDIHKGSTNSVTDKTVEITTNEILTEVTDKNG